MKIKFIIIIILTGSCISGAYYYYYYTQTLMFSEVIGTTESNIATIAINLFDFDTGLTRQDIHHLHNTKDYWLKRMREVKNISNPEIKARETEILLADMMEDQTMKKITKLILSMGFDIGIEILNCII
jgi:hypothetical protein